MKPILILFAQLALLTVLTGCTTLGRLGCSEEGQIAKYDGNKWRCAADATAATTTTKKGLLWINHHDMVVSDSAPVTLTNNGTTLFIKPKHTGPFPKKGMLGIYVPTIPPGYNITGLRICYGIVGNQSKTEIDHLRLSQYQINGSTSGVWPRYSVKLEDTTVGNLAPNPPAGGFSYDDPAGYICVDSSPGPWKPCLDQGNGTISAGIGYQLGDADDFLAIMSAALQYDTSCKPH